MKEVHIQNENEGLSDDKGSESKILNMNSKDSYDEIKQDKSNKKKTFKHFIISYFNKLFIIRAMLAMAFLIFFYYLFLLIHKGLNIYKTQFYIYFQRDLSQNELNDLKTHQLIDEKNIKIIKELNISLNIEHSKYVHLKITDLNKKRWEVPQELLNEDYFKTINLKNSTRNFKINYLQTNKDCSFELYFESRENGKINKHIFYSFDITKNFLYSNNYINFESHLTSDDIFGFGERIHHFKLKEGIYTIWPRDQKNLYDDGQGGKNLYGHQPIGLHKTKYKDIWLGFVFLNSNAQDVQIRKKETETILSHKTIGGIIDYYIIVDNSPENVIKDIHYLIGIPIMPPYWSLGNHQCRWGFNNFETFKNVYENYKLKKIPIDAMWTDIDAMKNFQIFTVNDNEFKELPDYVKNVIHKDYGYYVPIIDIGLQGDDSQNIYVQNGNKYNLFIKSGYTGDNLMAKVWPGKTIFPDFFNPDVYKTWDKGLDDYYDLIPYDGFWLDMNEISNLKKKGKCPGEILDDESKCDIIKDFKISYLPGYTDYLNSLTTGTINMNGVTYGGNIIYNNKPLISVYQARQTYNYLKLRNKRPFIVTRANSFGIGKYAFHWLGDNFSFNEYIEYSISGIFTYNIFGIPFTGADISGFRNNSNGKLNTRWYNIGAFYPFTRNHNRKQSVDHYPWSFGEEYEAIIKKDIEYKYSLLRYYYSQLYLVSLNEKGGFFKPVMFEYPNDMYSYENIESKIMLGEAILICAFFDNDEKDKEFILPNSNFNLYPSGKNIINYSSEDDINLRKKTLSGKLSELHIFVRGGYILPMQDTFSKFILNTHYLREEKINLIINPDHEDNSKGVIIYDNEETNDVTNYIRVDLEFKNKILKIKTTITDSPDYNYKDHILNKIEIWRINEVFKEGKIKDPNVKLIIKLKNKNDDGEVEEGIFVKAQNKIIFEVKDISLFDINEIIFNKVT